MPTNQPPKRTAYPLSDSEIALLCDIGTFTENDPQKVRMVQRLLAEGFVEPVDANMASTGARYQLTEKAQQVLIKRGVGLNEG